MTLILFCDLKPWSKKGPFMRIFCANLTHNNMELLPLYFGSRKRRPHEQAPAPRLNIQTRRGSKCRRISLQRPSLNFLGEGKKEEGETLPLKEKGVKICSAYALTCFLYSQRRASPSSSHNSLLLCISKKCMCLLLWKFLVHVSWLPLKSRAALNG